MTKKVVIADAGPLIAFGRIDHLSLLSDTLGKIILPEVVANECLRENFRPGADAIQKAVNKKIITIDQNTHLQKHHDFLEILGEGESAAIVLALHLGVGLLIDERLGRNTAKKMNIKIIGTAGVLLLAKKNKLIKKISPLIYQLKDVGYYLSAALVREILTRAKEI